MCGILGWIGHARELRDRGEHALDLMSHRGPDAGGLWVSDVAPVALGSRRLAILDLRTEADQPMRRGASVLVHNGEIYNYVEIRRELLTAGKTFQTGSDTEVVLAAFDQWGESAVERFNGMFAFALWDASERTLTLARDRFGEKPLYYATGETCFHFASEIKALLQFPCVERRPDQSSVYEYLATGRVPDGTPRTFFAGIRQLTPATTLRVGGDARQLGERRYWQLHPDEGAAALSFEDAAARLDALFEDSVRIRLRSDVPVGTSLSGGIDSSLVATTVARLRDPSGPPQRTYTARHRAADIDEGRFVAPVVAQTRARASETWIEADDLPKVIERLVWHQDEPFPHTSMFAQWKVYELAKRDGVTVLLDGQGADEVFGGYHSLSFGAAWVGMLGRLDLLELTREISSYRQVHGTGLPSIAGYIAAATMPGSLQARARRLRWRSGRLIAKLDRGSPAHEPMDCGSIDGSLHRALCQATVRTSLPGLLRFADRSSMAHSIEVRLPFLDHRVVEFAFGLPEQFLVRRGSSKRILRALLQRDLPAIAERRDKIGFATPEHAWFTGPLRGWMTELLRSAAGRDFYRRGAVDDMWQEVLEGRTPTQVAWRVVNIELWYRRYIDPSSVSPPDVEAVRT